MKKIVVMNREMAKKYSFRTDIPKTIIVSISDANQAANTFYSNNNILDVLRLNFDDVDTDSKNAMQPSTAETIISFVNQYINNIDQIVVHCGAGISRSVGVAAALMLIINGDDKDIFENGRYCPNMLCYKLILNAYFGTYNSEAIDEKLTANIEAWRRSNYI